MMVYRTTKRNAQQWSRIASDTGLLERGLQGGGVGVTGHRGAGNLVDSGALRLQGFLTQQGDGLLVDERRAGALGRRRGLDIRQLLAGHGDGHLHRPPPHILARSRDSARARARARRGGEGAFEGRLAILPLCYLPGRGG